MDVNLYNTPNIKIIKIHDSLSLDGGKSIVLNMNLFNRVFIDLSPTAFALYCNLAANEEGYDYKFSPAFLEKEIGRTARAWRAVRQELEEKGYIVGNDFYEEPPHIRAAREKADTAGR